MINYWSYKKNYISNKNKILSEVNKTLHKGNIFFGKQLNKFEKRFTKKYKSKYGIAVGSNRCLLISLLALIKKDEVIVPLILLYQLQHYQCWSKTSLG